MENTDSQTPAPSLMYEGDFLLLIRDRHWEYVRRKNASGAGFIVALTVQHELVLVEQYRLPLRRRVIELPAGIIGDDPGLAEESPEASALRELEEETGYRGTSAQALCSGPVAAGMTDEIGHFTMVSGLEKTGAGGGVEGENIVTHVIPLDQVPNWIASKRAQGLLVDPRIYIALYFARPEPALPTRGGNS